MDVDTNQPLGTPTWIDLGVPDLDRALEFYGARLRLGLRRRPGGVRPVHELPAARPPRRGALGRARSGAAGCFWNVYLATPDCDRTAERAREAGGVLLDGADGRDGPGPDGARPRPGRRAVRAVAGPRAHRRAGWSTSRARWCATTWSRPTRARPRSSTPPVFDFTLDRNEDMPEFDFTFLRRPDGHEIGGIMGAPGQRVGVEHHVRGRRHRRGGEPGPRRAAARSDGATDFLYGRLATITDPFGAEFSIITRPAP